MALLKPVLVVCHSKLEPAEHELVTKLLKFAVVAGQILVIVVVESVGDVVPALHATLIITDSRLTEASSSG